MSRGLIILIILSSLGLLTTLILIGYYKFKSIKEKSELKELKTEFNKAKE